MKDKPMGGGFFFANERTRYGGNEHQNIRTSEVVAPGALKVPAPHDVLSPEGGVKNKIVYIYTQDISTVHERSNGVGVNICRAPREGPVLSLGINPTNGSLFL